MARAESMEGVPAHLGAGVLDPTLRIRPAATQMALVIAATRPSALVGIVDPVLHLYPGGGGLFAHVGDGQGPYLVPALGGADADTQFRGDGPPAAHEVHLVGRSHGSIHRWALLSIHASLSDARSLFLAAILTTRDREGWAIEDQVKPGPGQEGGPGPAPACRLAPQGQGTGARVRKLGQAPAVETRAPQTPGQEAPPEAIPAQGLPE